MNTFCLFGLNKWHFKKTTAILYVCSSIKFVVVIFIAQSDHAMVGTFVSYPFYTTDNGKKILKFTTLV